MPRHATKLSIMPSIDSVRMRMFAAKSVRFHESVAVLGAVLLANVRAMSPPGAARARSRAFSRQYECLHTGTCQRNACAGLVMHCPALAPGNLPVEGSLDSGQVLPLNGEQLPSAVLRAVHVPSVNHAVVQHTSRLERGPGDDRRAKIATQHHPLGLVCLTRRLSKVVTLGHLHHIVFNGELKDRDRASTVLSLTQQAG